MVDDFAAKKARMFALENPCANEDQKQTEETALRIAAHPLVTGSRSYLLDRYRKCAYFKTAEAQALYESTVDEYILAYAVRIASSDSNYPRIGQHMCPAHDWLGHHMPSARLNGDNGDNCYRLMGVDALGRYELHGKRPAQPPADESYTLNAAYGGTITIGSIIGGAELEVEPNGEFLITIDKQPANGRKNHLQFVASDARFIYLRDSFNDWMSEKPTWLAIKRTNDPTRDPLSDDQLGIRLAAALDEDIELSTSHNIFGLRSGGVNRMWGPLPTGPMGGLHSQRSAHLLFDLQDDDAIVLTLTKGEATYLSVWAYDPGFLSLDYANRQSSLNLSQSRPNADGTFTYVLARHDPGVHNWIDTVGWAYGSLVLRWQGLKREVKDAPRVIACELTKIGKLGTFISIDHRVTAAERAEQIALRTRAVASRWIME